MKEGFVHPHPDPKSEEVSSDAKEKKNLLKVINVKTGERKELDLDDPEVRDQLINSLKNQPGEFD
jgi:hypothetical protein